MMITKAQINSIRSLRDKSSRVEQGLFMAEGDKLIEELLNNKLEVTEIYKTSKSQLGAGLEVSQNDMSRMSNLKTPSCSLALVKIPDTKNDVTKGLRLALDGVQDPGNLGTVIRVADWFGIKTIYCSNECADCFSPKVVQATMGAVSRVSVIYGDLPKILKEKRGTRIYGTFLEHSENIYAADLNTENAILVMGSEGQGISNSVAECIQQRLFIPPYRDIHTVESLNVAVATAVAVAEFRRRN